MKGSFEKTANSFSLCYGFVRVNCIFVLTFSIDGSWVVLILIDMILQKWTSIKETVHSKSEGE